MKTWLGLFAASAMIAPAHGAPLVTVIEGLSPSGLTTFTFNIDPNELAGGYDTVAADTTIGGGIFSDDGNPFGVSLFNQVGEPNATPTPGGDDSGIVPAATLFAGLDSASALSGTLTTPGSNNISLAAFDFATVAFTPDSTSLGGTYGFTFIDNGRVVAEVFGAFGAVIPEPAAALLASLCLTVASSRRRA